MENTAPAARAMSESGLADLMKQAHKSLEGAKSWEATDVVGNAAFQKWVLGSLRHKNRFVAFEGPDLGGKTTLSTAVAQSFGVPVSSSSSVSNELLELAGIPAAEKADFFAARRNLLPSLLFFVFANATVLESASQQNPDGVSVIDASFFRTLSAHKAKLSGNDQHAELIFRELEKLLLHGVASDPSARFVFLYTSPDARLARLMRRGGNVVDRDSALALQSEWWLLDYDKNIRMMGVPVFSMFTGKAASHPFKMPDFVKVFEETDDASGDVRRKLASMGAFLRTWQ